MTKRVGLQWKLTVALVVIVLTPLLASYFMIDQISTHAANTYAKEAADNVVAMEKALDAYRDLFETKKQLQAEIADRLGKRAACQCCGIRNKNGGIKRAACPA